MRLWDYQRLDLDNVIVDDHMHEVREDHIYRASHEQAAVAVPAMA